MKKTTRAKAALTQPKVKERVRLKSDESVSEVQKALRAAQAEIKRERKARIQAEKALTEAQEKLADARLEVERNPQSQTRRISFVVRLTLDEQGQYERTEIEHVLSGRKQNFLNLDGDLLVAFMKACVTPETSPEDAVSTKPR